MRYIEVTFKIDDTDFYRDLLIDTLGNEGPYESFVETADGLKAYVGEPHFDASWLAATVQAFPVPLQYSVEQMEDRDWNAEWEKGHEAVLVGYEGGTVWVRAPFHPHRDDVDYEVVIEPKMSFGTAHHPTTAMMLSYVAEMPMVGRHVLDMGCGTAVLGILAKLRGAARVVGVDVDEWAFRNAQENAATNGVEIDLRMGGAEAIGMERFGMVLANINRNILLADMDRYAEALEEGGSLVVSGFYEADDAVLEAKAATLGLTAVSRKRREGWSAIAFVKSQR